MKVYSNEIVFRGHPDKVCDQISDALLDACMSADKNSRCGIEVMGGKGKIFVTGEVTTKAKLVVPAIAKRVLREIGYSDDVEVVDNLGVQSPDIALGTNDEVGGAGDQGMMFGYACNDTEEMLPTAQVILQKLSRFYDELRKTDEAFLADGKAQITGEYDEGEENGGLGKLVAIRDFTISYQNTEENRERTDKILIDKVNEICDEYGVKVKKFLINPTGKFLIGGFTGDAGLTGRKIVVDSYQSFAQVGGGAFSGKDCTKVDRSGAYKARELAKKFLKEKDLKWCLVQLSYAIGIAEPLAIYIKSDKGDIDPPAELYAECTPKRIIDDLGLRDKKFEDTAKFGHFVD